MCPTTRSSTRSSRMDPEASKMQAVESWSRVYERRRVTRERSEKRDVRAKTESGHEKAVSVCAAADVAPMGVVPLLEYRGSTVLARCYDFCSPSFAPTKSEDHKLGQAWSAEGVRGSEASTEESGHALQERAAGVLSTLACISGERRAAEGSRGAADDADAVVLYMLQNTHGILLLGG